MGGATGPQVGEKVNAQPMLDDGGEGFCGSKNRSVIAPSLNVNSSRFPPIYESKFGAATTDFRPK